MASTTKHRNNRTLSTRLSSGSSETSLHTDLPSASIRSASITVTSGHTSICGTLSPTNVGVTAAASASDINVPSRFLSARPRRSRTRQSSRWSRTPRQCSQNVVIPRLAILTSCWHNRHLTKESRVWWSFAYPKASPQYACSNQTVLRIFLPEIKRKQIYKNHPFKTEKMKKPRQTSKSHPE